MDRVLHRVLGKETRLIEGAERLCQLWIDRNHPRGAIDPGIQNLGNASALYRYRAPDFACPFTHSDIVILVASVA